MAALRRDVSGVPTTVPHAKLHRLQAAVGTSVPVHRVIVALAKTLVQKPILLGGVLMAWHLKHC